MEFLPPTRKGLPLQQLPQQRESLSLFCLQGLVVSEANCPSLKGFIDPTAERKKTSWHFCLGKDSFSSWERLLAGCCCCCDLYSCGYLKSRTRFSSSSHSVSWHREATEGMLCFSCWCVSGHGPAMVRVSGKLWNVLCWTQGQLHPTSWGFPHEHSPDLAEHISGQMCGGPWPGGSSEELAWHSHIHLALCRHRDSLWE